MINYTLSPIEFNGKVYEQKHGGAFDRGAADSYYHRPRDPRMYPNGTYNPPRIEMSLMSPEEIDAYHAGYDWNEQFGDKKQW
jgi:hypothetical protein